MIKKSTVTIGIPVYNEEGNIGFLLESLLQQAQESFVLTQIIIYADGCTDNTHAVAKSVAGRKVKIIANSVRQGIVAGLNRIVEETRTDILVILNADILIKDKFFLDTLVQPIINHEADLVAGLIKEIPPKTFVEKILFASIGFKRSVFEMFHNGNNFYNCNGPARALSRDLYSSIKFMRGIADDMYNYFFAIDKKFVFKYVKKAEVYYKLPGTLSDHFRQSARFIRSMRNLSQYFDAEFISDEIKIPLRLFFITGITNMVESPLYFPLYLLLTAYVSARIWLTKPTFEDKWVIAESSKLSK